MTRPCRRITLHLSQMGLTLGFTFTASSILLGLSVTRASARHFVVVLLVPINNAAPGQVVGRELHHDAVLGQDADVVLPHLSADVGENLVSVLQLNAEHRIGQGFDHATLDLDGTVFLGHYLSEILRVLTNRWRLSAQLSLRLQNVSL
jgi:hypothetical protein